MNKQGVFSLMGKDLFIGSSVDTSNAEEPMDLATWDRTFQPITNPREGSLMFDRRDDQDRAFLSAIDAHHIWTDRDSEIDNGFRITAGAGSVNVVGYYVTLVPWTEDQEDLIISYD